MESDFRFLMNVNLSFGAVPVSGTENSTRIKKIAQGFARSGDLDWGAESEGESRVVWWWWWWWCNMLPPLHLPAIRRYLRKRRQVSDARNLCQ